MNIMDAAYATVHDHSGGANALAPRFSTRGGGTMSPSVLNSKVDPGKDSHHLTLAEASKLMAFTADHRILHSLSREHGYVCVPVSTDGIPASDLAILDLVTMVWDRNGKVGREVHNTLADGRVEQHEIDSVKHFIYQVEQVLHQLVLRLHEMKDD